MGKLLLINEVVAIIIIIQNNLFIIFSPDYYKIVPSKILSCKTNFIGCPQKPKITIDDLSYDMKLCKTLLRPSSYKWNNFQNFKNERKGTVFLPTD